MKIQSFLTIFSFSFLLLFSMLGFSQEVPIQHYSIDSNGIANLEVNSTSNDYFILKVKHHIDSNFNEVKAIELGKEGKTVISETVGAYPADHYKILKYNVNTPFDTDQDGKSDIVEFQNIPKQNPINSAFEINKFEGAITLDNFTNFKSLSVTEETVQWSEFLNGQVYLKYIITDFNSDEPKVFFINSNNYKLHGDFANKVGIDYLGEHVKKGQIIYYPALVSPNGKLGTFAFNFSNGHGDDFTVTQRTHELLSANILFLQNNFTYFVTSLSEDEYQRDSLLYLDSRIPLLKEKDVYADVDYLGLNSAEGFGFFRHMDEDEDPNPKDIVLYDDIPNEIPRVGGIISSEIQTPLSHANLRAIQDKIPNAFIREPLKIDSIAKLLDHYIYYKVEQGQYYIREATQQEVDDWFDDLRPDEPQNPPLNLNYTSILPLESIRFKRSDAFGAKCANVAEMLTFGFPDGTIPNGFGVPFYFYQEFMKYNNFFEEIKTLRQDSTFINDREFRKDELKAFRKKIKKAEMPTWMEDELADMHEAFPEGTSVRCRSSSNVEDLPGFNGAGLYDSKTQHPDEGHISKSIKQVYASFWNLSAYDEREFHRVDQFIGSMGVLCHPNYKNEKANGVAVTTDPIYNTSNTYYINTQIGEDLITNPKETSIPEELILDKTSVSKNDFIVIRRSNLIGKDSMLLSKAYIDELRTYLTVIHDEFETLYRAKNNPTFAMDIEFKVTEEGQLSIKQARPWATFSPKDEGDTPNSQFKSLSVYPNPVKDELNILCTTLGIHTLQIYNTNGKLIFNKKVNPNIELNISINTEQFLSGLYIIVGVSKEKMNATKFVKE
ncbi:MAG: PEP/pyruvate-binding domain-containing protein [Flavobacteriales bacterium]